MKRYLSLLLALALMASLLIGCSSRAPEAYNKGSYDMAVDSEAMWETMPAMDVPMESGKGESLSSNSSLEAPADTGRKLIKTVHLTAETETYDKLITAINGTISELGGYVEAREVNGSRRRSCYMTIRIPADRLDLFVSHVRENANVTSSTESAQDVTLQYVDTEAKVTALETEQARLLELLATAESLDDILAIESRLSDVTYELERYATYLRTLENQVTYATVNLQLWEVEVLTPVEEPTVWDRITSGFSENLEGLGEDLTNIFVWIVTGSPYLVFWGALLGLIVCLIIRANRNKYRKPTNPTPPPAAE